MTYLVIQTDGATTHYATTSKQHSVDCDCEEIRSWTGHREYALEFDTLAGAEDEARVRENSGWHRAGWTVRTSHDACTQEAGRAALHLHDLWCGCDLPIVAEPASRLGFLHVAELGYDPPRGCVLATDSWPRNHCGAFRWPIDGEDA